jgi:hypothetical protein
LIVELKSARNILRLGFIRYKVGMRISGTTKLLVLWQLGIFFFNLPLHAQYVNPTFGIVLKPIIPSSLFTNTVFTSTKDNITYTINPTLSGSFGAVMRLGLYNQFSFESGIIYTQRSYDLKISAPESQVNTDFKIVDYEIPVLGMVYIRISEKAYLNTSFGFSLDFFPNDIGKKKDSLLLIGKRVYWLQPAFVAQAGFEYRTENYGYFYLGGAYHRMFGNMFALRMDFLYNNNLTQFQRFMTGSYFDVELKWLFPNNRTEPEAY